MNRNFLQVFFLFCSFYGACQPADSGLPSPGDQYRFFVDLTQVTDDELAVTLVPPKPESNEVRYCFPKIVPGIYGAMDFGQYVQDVEAFDQKNKALPVTRENTNVWRIGQAKRMRRITYRVKDTWDNLEGYKKDFYRSAGATFHAGEGFVLNNNALYGYFEGMSDRVYQIQYRKPEGFFGATALENVVRTDQTETMTAPNYRELVDAPVLFSLPDTTQFMIGETEILISVFNAMPGKNYPYANYLREVIEPQLEAMRKYFGGALPVKRYAFLIYFEVFDDDNLLADALEHTRSSLYLYAGRGMGKIAGLVQQVSAHEFLHIVSPLNIHSEKIEAYNFLDPLPSKHLWLYEGMTEYTSLHVPLVYKTITLNDFLIKIADKYRNMQQYDAKLSLTDLSLNSLTRQDQYYNVYLKGALVCLCLDLKLRELSEGKWSTTRLMETLAKKYGPDKPFADDQLFDEIAAMTYPEIRDFFRKYVEGTEPLPLTEYLLKAGVILNPADYSVDMVGSPTAEQWNLRKYWIGR